MINNNQDSIDPLIKVCLIHYQFESIHPFYDGNVTQRHTQKAA